MNTGDEPGNVPTGAPIASTVEILEVRKKADLSQGDVLVPNAVRINGQPVYTSAEHPVVVNEISVEHQGAVYVTLTLLARRVIIDDEVKAQAPR